MIRFKFMGSIVSKLILLNGLILIAFSGVIIVNLLLAKQTKNLVITFVDEGVNHVVANEKLGRELAQLSAEIDLLVGTFTLERNRLINEADRLSAKLNAIVRASSENTVFTDHLSRFALSFDTLLAQCRHVDDLVTRFEQVDAEFNLLFDLMETAVTDHLIASKLEGREYEINSLEQIAVLIPDLRYLLLKIKLHLAESERAHLKRQIPTVAYEALILAMIDEMESSIAAAVTAGQQLALFGNDAIDAIYRLRTDIVALHQAMRTLQSSLDTLYRHQSLVIDSINDMGGQVAAAAGHMRQKVVKNLHAYGTIMGIMSLLIIAVTIAVGLYGARIAKPIQRLSRSASAIASGDLDRAIHLEGNDELAVLSRSFLTMRDAIREKINDLAEQNTTLIREIALREETEKALRQSEKKYRTLLESLPQKIIFKDKHSIFVSCNENYSRDVKLHPEEVVGKTDFDFFPKELAEKYIADDRRIVANGKTEEIEEPYILNGQTVIVNTVKTPVRDQDGETVGILGIFWDITEKKRIEDELRKYEQITSTSKDLMSIVGTNYIYQAVNDAYIAMYGKDREGIVGHTIAEIDGEEMFRLKIQSNFDKCLNGEVVNFQEWFDYPDAGGRFMDVAFYPFYGRDSKVSGVVINARDVTQTRLLEEKLAQAQKMEAIGTLAGGIAHDFNNILGAIIGYTELLLLEVTEPGEIREWVQNLLAAAERAKDLVKQILAFSRQSRQEIKPIKLDPIVNEAVAMMRASIPTTIEIRREIKNTVGSVMADATQIHQVLINLCTNAAHAMKESGGVLTIGLDDVEASQALRAQFPNLKSGDYFKLIVKDTGHGIAAEHLSRIFEPYYTTKEKGVGTGLGLATVHGIIESFDGKVEVTSTPGHGSAFTILLPKIHPREGLDPAASERTLQTGQERILLVDDEAALLVVGRRMLERLGYHVETTNSSRSAMEMFNDDPQRFDLVITDQTMPTMTGQELALRLIQIRSDIPIILCTGYSDLIDEQKAKAIGVRQYLKKPVTMNTLSEAVRQAIEKNNETKP